ncbi:unnamed protein product [Symbiodinium sp. CCMP2592]|nr:unnamed protein product [Symbiodinium sp. CCMP2592]
MFTALSVDEDSDEDRWESSWKPDSLPAWDAQQWSETVWATESANNEEEVQTNDFWLLEYIVFFLDKLFLQYDMDRIQYFVEHAVDKLTLELLADNDMG